MVPISGTVTWKVGEELEEERFQLLIGAVDLVDEEDGSAFVSGVDRLAAVA